MKNQEWERRVQSIHRVISTLPTLAEACDSKAVINYFKQAVRCGQHLLKFKEFNDAFQAKFTGKWATQVDQVNNSPEVAVALDIAEAQQRQYTEDLQVETPPDQVRVQPGDYDAANIIINGVSTMVSYNKLFAKYMQQSFAGNWVILHYGSYGSSEKNMKDNMTVINHVDKNFRAHMDALKTTALPAIPDYLVANQLFASLPQDLKNIIIDKNPGYFQDGARPLLSWSFAEVFHMATISEASPKYIQDQKRNKIIARISTVGTSISGVAQKDTQKNTQSSQDCYFGAIGDGSKLLTRNEYYQAHSSAYNAMSRSDRDKYHGGLNNIRANGPKIPAANGQFYNTARGKSRVCMDITNLPGIKTCGGCGHDAPQCTLNKALFVSGDSSGKSAQEQQNLGSANQDSILSNTNTIAMLRSILTQTAAQAPSTAPVLPVANSAATSAVSTAAAAPTASDFNRDMMSIMRQLMPGNDGIDEVTRKYFTQAIITGELNSRNAPVSVLHEDGQEFGVDTHAEVNICSLAWFESRRILNAASRVMPPTPGVQIYHCGDSDPDLGYLGNGFTFTIIAGQYTTVPWHIFGRFAAKPTFGRTFLEKLGTTIFMASHHLTYQFGRYFKQLPFVSRLRQACNFKLPPVHAITIDEVDQAHDVFSIPGFAAVWNSTTTLTAYCTLNNNTSKDQSASIEDITSIRGRQDVELLPEAAEAIPEAAEAIPEDTRAVTIPTNATMTTSTLSDKEILSEHPHQPLLHQDSPVNANLQEAVKDSKSGSQSLLPNPDADIKNGSNINNSNAVPSTVAGQSSMKVDTITNNDLETITDEFSRAINTIMLHGAQIGPFSPYKVSLKNEASISISPSPNCPTIPLHIKLGSIDCARTLFDHTARKAYSSNVNNRNQSQKCPRKDNI